MMDKYKQASKPPPWALRTIQAGRLKGKSDINPQWRYQIMTELYGLCGYGWKFQVERLWTEQGPDNQVFAFAQVALQVKEIGSAWSEPIPGIGGHMLIVKEKAGPYANDEAYKMAVTDALSTAMKMLGVAADVYTGTMDGSKYSASRNEPQPPAPAKSESPMITDAQIKKLATTLTKQGVEDREHRLAIVNSLLGEKDMAPVRSAKELTRAQASLVIDGLERPGTPGKWTMTEMDVMPREAQNV
jgi:hypothetical protein